jgi:hypothetical protein
VATFQEQIVDLVGTIYEDTAAMSQFLTDGVRQVVNVLPQDRLFDILTVHPLNATDGVTFTLNDSGGHGRGRIVSVSRGDSEATKQTCRLIPISLVSRVQDPEDLMFTSDTDPVYYISGGILNVIPTPTDAQPAEVVYIPLTSVASGESEINGFPNDLEHIVVLYAAIRSAQALLAEEEDTELYIPMIKTLKADYNQALTLLGAKVGKVEDAGGGQNQQALLNQMLEYGK